MKLRQFQVDAFASRVFEGNPAAVVPLEAWLPDSVMQAIGDENNLSETAFLVPSGTGFDLRWFTPRREVDLCGHATLASAHVLFAHLGYSGECITFHTRSGDLLVRRSGNGYAMDFPAQPPVHTSAPAARVVPDHAQLGKLDLRGVVVTARGDHHDFVSRFFAPKFGVYEDPVTGSAHCALTPYWSGRLGRTELRARQVSKRGGDVFCTFKGERVELVGNAVTFMEAVIGFDVA
jgi:predicted PhzF superfamily epimerase YddE/YHI9